MTPLVGGRAADRGAALRRPFMSNLFCFSARRRNGRKSGERSDDEEEGRTKANNAQRGHKQRFRIKKFGKLGIIAKLRLSRRIYRQAQGINQIPLVSKLNSQAGSVFFKLQEEKTLAAGKRPSKGLG